MERRRRWSAAEKKRLVAATLEPGASVTAIARDAGIAPGWRRQARAQARFGFAPVEIAPAAGPFTVAHGRSIEIEFACGARMRIMGAVDVATVTVALAVLAKGGRR